MVTLTLPIHVPSSLATIIGTDVAGLPMCETVEVPRLTPAQETAAARADRMLDKIERGAYRTQGRQSKALRRYFRMARKGGSINTSQRFACVSRLVFTTAGDIGSAPILFGYASGASLIEGIAAGITH